MTQPPPIHLQPMPSATILNYVAINVADQPTRVRIIASWCVLGYANFPLALAGLLWLRLSPYLFNPRWIFWDFTDFAVRLALAVLATGVTVMMLILPHYIRRGRPWACLFSLFLILPILVVCILLAGFLASYALLDVITPFKQPPQYIQLLWLIPAAILAVLALIANDLRRYLQWIHKLPRQEKPPVKFLNLPR